ncbi:MAG: helix-turn-helix domain-containing protein [Proteobacteria bacterium]|nr:helix-turn-helix domain-containing protein [Pseudomonadota bacterium]
MSQNVLLNVKEVADFLRINVSTVYSWAQNGELPAIKIGRSWRFRQSDLEIWLEENRQDKEPDLQTRSNPDQVNS